MNYDSIAIDMVRYSHPQLSFQEDELRWNYNFLKGKLNEAFVIKPKAAEKPTLHYPELKTSLSAPERSSTYAVPIGNSQEVTLSVDGYAADRTSRAVFWDAALNQRPMEFHVGDAREFRESLAARG